MGSYCSTIDRIENEENDDTKTINVDIEDKLICLIETIQKDIYRIENDENEEPLEIDPMYFEL